MPVMLSAVMPNVVMAIVVAPQETAAKPLETY